MECTNPIIPRLLSKQIYLVFNQLCRVGVSRIYPSTAEPLENTGFDGMPDGNTARFDSKMIATIKT